MDPSFWRHGSSEPARFQDEVKSFHSVGGESDATESSHSGERHRQRLTIPSDDLSASSALCCLVPVPGRAVGVSPFELGHRAFAREQGLEPE